MVVNFALTKNLKRYSRSGLNRRRALYKLLKNKKAVNKHYNAHIHIIYPINQSYIYHYLFHLSHVLFFII